MKDKISCWTKGGKYGYPLKYPTTNMQKKNQNLYSLNILQQREIN